MTPDTRTTENPDPLLRIPCKCVNDGWYVHDPDCLRGIAWEARAEAAQGAAPRAEGLDVETLARAAHDAWPKPGCTASIHDHNWGADSFYGSFAAAILARLSKRRDKEGTE